MSAFSLRWAHVTRSQGLIVFVTSLTFLDVNHSYQDQIWSAQDWRQIVGRAHRQPQKDEVKFVNIITEDTADVIINEMARQKQDMFDVFVDKGPGRALEANLNGKTAYNAEPGLNDPKFLAEGNKDSDVDDEENVSHNVPVLGDPTKPLGWANNPDGTLKDPSTMTFVDSPSQENIELPLSFDDDTPGAVVNTGFDDTDVADEPPRGTSEQTHDFETGDSSVSVFRPQFRPSQSQASRKAPLPARVPTPMQPPRDKTRRGRGGKRL
ncbi:hypothetical protein PM082_012663 [Marasmius tenuissimus]|nr:hypothetical protein PM082_012663 [Marasmius tenuissimus]